MYGLNTGQRSVEIEFEPPSMPAYNVVVSLRGEHDLSSAAQVSKTLAMVSGACLVDLSACTFIDSTLIALLIRTARRTTTAGGRIDLLITPGSAVARTLELIDTRSLLTLYEHTARTRSPEQFLLRSVKGG